MFTQEFDHLHPAGRSAASPPEPEPGTINKPVSGPSFSTSPNNCPNTLADKIWERERGSCNRGRGSNGWIEGHLVAPALVSPALHCIGPIKHYLRCKGSLLLQKLHFFIINFIDFSLTNSTWKSDGKKSTRFMRNSTRVSLVDHSTEHISTKDNL